MKTEILEIDPANPDGRLIERAAAVIRKGGLVAFPTETVYGLGANAFDPVAVRRIYEAKGRPADNPVIVHVASVEGAKRIVAVWSEPAQRLAHRFWPGPLTLVLPKKECVPKEVTAGGPAVAVRIPRNAIALALLVVSERPIAAPSANRSSRISPTRAEHVLRDLGGRIDLILDGGPSQVGIESTVLDLSSDRPRILRPGMISKAEIESVIGPLKDHSPGLTVGPMRSPGQMVRHYAPRTPVEIAAGDGRVRVRELLEHGLQVGYVSFGAVGQALLENEGFLVPVTMPETPGEYGARLYEALHRLDDRHLDRIIVELPPDTPEWLAIRDRLWRASAENNAPGGT